HLIAINRDLYRRATPGIALLDPRVRPAIETATILYGEILDRIEAADHQVFAARATVPTHRRILVAAKGFTAAVGRRWLGRGPRGGSPRRSEGFSGGATDDLTGQRAVQ